MKADLDKEAAWAEFKYIQEAFGNKSAVADAIGSHRSTPGRWHTHQPDPQNEIKIAALRLILLKLRTLYRPETAENGLPDLDGVLYSSTLPVSAIAEVIRDFRGRTLENEDLILYGNRLSLAIFELSPQVTLVNLCDEYQLAQIKVDPIQVATGDRTVS